MTFRQASLEVRNQRHLPETCYPPANLTQSKLPRAPTQKDAGDFNLQGFLLPDFSGFFASPVKLIKFIGATVNGCHNKTSVREDGHQ